jgi:hypothetical protein
MQFFFSLLSLVAVASALQVTSPGGSNGWTTSGSNYFDWTRVDTDALNFTAVLVNQQVTPPYQQVLDAFVDATLGKQVAHAPSGGFLVGSGYQVNLVKDTDDLNTIYAQSQQFSIEQSNTTTSSSATNPANTPATVITPNETPTDSVTGTATGTLNPTSSTTSKSGADRMAVSGSAGLIFGVLAAMVL